MSFFFLNRKPLKKAKAERPQVNKSFALLMINTQHIVKHLSFQHPFWIQCYQKDFLLDVMLLLQTYIYIYKGPYQTVRLHTRRHLFSWRWSLI